MKGLLIKDIRIMMQNRKLLFVIAAMIMLFTLLGGEDMASFVVVYITLMTSMFALNTMAHDEMDHSITFLMCFPIERRTYVVEKYWFSQLSCLIGWAVSTAAVLVIMRDNHMEFIMASTAIAGVLALFQFIILPFQFKFGYDKGKIVLIGVVAIFSGSIAVLVNLSEKQVGGNNGIAKVILDLLTDLTNMSPVLIAVYGVILYLISLVISLVISTRVIDKKEY